MTNKLIFIFLDGFGLGHLSEANPFTKASLPFFDSIIKQPFLNGIDVQQDNLLVKGIDACLGVEGIPQSATGQTALLTGVNASQLLGYHLPAFPNSLLKDIIQRDNILKRISQSGKKAIFANSYSPRYFDLVDLGKRQHSVTTLCVYAAQLPFKNMNDLKSGKAVHWDITRESLVHFHEDGISPILPETAGQHLAMLAKENDFVLFECFLPDMLGHKKDRTKSIQFLELLDCFLSSIYQHKEDSVSILISSDHGNIEDLTIGSHTKNPVPLIVIGNAASHFQSITSIMEVFDHSCRFILSNQYLPN